MLIRILFKLSLVCAVCFLLYAGMTRIVLPRFIQSDSPAACEAPVSPEAVVMQLKGLNQLNCAQSTIQTIVTTEDSTRLLGLPIGSTKLLYIGLGEVRAGVDLSEMDVSQISISDSVKVSIPQARILDSKIDIGRSYVYDVRESTFFAPGITPLQSEAQQEALKRVEKAAIEAGLLDLANQNATEIVKKLVEDFVEKEVTVLVE